jgi:hypothetical protein
VKSTFPPHDQAIIELLKKLETHNAEYPPELLAARRAAFLSQLEQHKKVGAVKEESFPQERIIEILESLKPVTAAYPPELLAARREAFLARIEQYNKVDAREELSPQDPVLKLLGNLKPGTDDYPSELMAAKRAAFIAQIKQRNSTGEQQELLPLHNGRLLKLLRHLKSIEIEYPLKLWSARRSAFVGQIRSGGMSVLEVLRAALQNMFKGKGKTLSLPTMDFRRTSMVIATLLVAVFVGSLLYGNNETRGGMFEPSLSKREGAHPGPVAAATGTGEVAQVICKPGYAPPLCLAKEFDKSSDLTFPGNGTARPAVAKDTIPGYSRVHQPAYVNDGLYGPGASWISNSAYSWIKIDLGEAKTINTITFGRDRLGTFNDGDPGQFFIAVALSDNIYADGDSSNDYTEYAEVYSSKEAGFDGWVSGPETVKASFEPVTARFVKITFENARTAVDEVEVFMIQPPGYVESPTQKPRENVTRATSTPVPTNTLIPTITSTAVPTNTSVPTFTNTPRPTNTPVPTDTNTPRPPNTPTDIPPTDTPEPPPTDTPEPPPTDTPEPPPTETSGPFVVPTIAIPTETPIELIEP